MPINRLIRTPTPGDGNPQYRPLTDGEKTLLGTGYNPDDQIETTYVGRVVALIEDNGYNDSDFNAYVQTDNGGFTKIPYGTTRCWTYLNTAKVDATPDVVTAYQQWRTDTSNDLRAKIADWDTKTVQVGSTVRVIGGRKYKGIEGTVGWVGPDRYRSSNMVTFYRFGIDPGDGADRVFVPDDYVEILVDGEWIEPNGQSNPFEKIAGLVATPEPQTVEA